MNFNLILIILIALILIFCIILYNGLKVLLTVDKEKGIVNYELKATILKIPIFTRNGTKGTDENNDTDEDSAEMEKDSEDSAESKENSEENEENNKSKEKSEEEAEEEDKGLIEKYKEIKPILVELKNSREELKEFLGNALKTINLKKLEGNLVIGLSNHTTTVKIASLIWSVGAIVNSTKPTALTVEPKFTEEIIDFEGKMELKVNLLILIFYALILLSHRNIIDLIRVIMK